MSIHDKRMTSRGCAKRQCVKCTFLHTTKLINLEMIQFSGRPGLDIHQGPRNDIFVFVLHMPSFGVGPNCTNCTKSRIWYKYSYLENGSSHFNETFQLSLA